ncbi:MAG TPA: DNA double-strand break repair nuclease NurA, partial [Phototrophicaceae bacterium]|nr:DNA double-strand break repair nuclease NurA [Phototrophicaceae bacterium]
NHLLFYPGTDVVGHGEMMKEYHGALVHLQDAGAILAGYVDNPMRSRMVIRLLHLLSIPEAELAHADMSVSPEMEGLRDIHLFDAVLEPGERSALMVQNSPRNLEYKKRGVSYEIAFFYLKVSTGYRNSMVRVDVPLWVARDKTRIDELHALLVTQCQMQGRNPYPYALTRADELAYVSGKDKAKLDEMIGLELRAKGVEPQYFSAKTWGKELARSTKRPYEM